MTPMTYKGYAARIEYSDEDGCFVGHIAGISDIVGFHGDSVEEVRAAFHEAVVQLPSPDVTVNTIADVIEPGYVLGDRLVRPAKVAVSVPAE